VGREVPFEFTGLAVLDSHHDLGLAVLVLLETVAGSVVGLATTGDFLGVGQAQPQVLF
jgi:hypothetical protein